MDTRTPRSVAFRVMAGDPLHTPVCDLLGIRVAIFLAPMANGPSTPALAGCVSHAGGLGCLGISGVTADEAGRQVREARELARGAPIAVNVQIGPQRAAHAQHGSPARSAGAARGSR